MCVYICLLLCDSSSIAIVCIYIRVYTYYSMHLFEHTLIYLCVVRVGVCVLCAYQHMIRIMMGDNNGHNTVNVKLHTVFHSSIDVAATVYDDSMIEVVYSQ